MDFLVFSCHRYVVFSTVKIYDRKNIHDSNSVLWIFCYGIFLSYIFQKRLEISLILSLSWIFQHQKIINIDKLSWILLSFIENIQQKIGLLSWIFVFCLNSNAEFYWLQQSFNRENLYWKVVKKVKKNIKKQLEDEMGTKKNKKTIFVIYTIKFIFVFPKLNQEEENVV